jgi:hypothetical protein
VYPGRDWFSVLSSTVVVLLGDRTIRVETRTGGRVVDDDVPQLRGGRRAAAIIVILDPDRKRPHLPG